MACSVAEQLRRSLLNQAFAGQLVPQEPADTPATLLLERIQAKRQPSRVSDEDV